MALALLLTATLALTPQEAETPEPQPAPAPAAKTDERAKTLLEEGESYLYRPTQDGLRSFSFDFAMDIPTLGNIGRVSCAWDAEAGPSVSFTASEAAADTPLPIPIEQLGPAMQGAGYEMVALQLNQMGSRLLETHTIAFEGVTDEGMIQLRCTPAFAGPESGSLPEQVVLLDADGIPQKIQVSIEQMGMTIDVSDSFSWKEVGEEDLLVMDKKISQQDAGFMGKVSQTTAFHVENLAGFYLVTGYTLEISGGAGPGMNQTQTLVFENFVINGQVAAVPPESAEATSESEG